MNTISVESADNFRPQHQTPMTHKAEIKADLYHFRMGDEPDGKTKLGIQTFFEPSHEPYILIGEEGCQAFEPSSAAIMLTLPKIIEAMFDWSIGACGNSEEITNLAMADYLEMLVKHYRRAAEPNRTRDRDNA